MVLFLLVDVSWYYVPPVFFSCLGMIYSDSCVCYVCLENEVCLLA